VGGTRLERKDGPVQRRRRHTTNDVRKCTDHLQQISWKLALPDAEPLVDPKHEGTLEALGLGSGAPVFLVSTDPEGLARSLFFE
jgi:hypothetical protein